MTALFPRLCGLMAGLALLSAPALAQTAAQRSQVINTVNTDVNTAAAISPQAAMAQAQAKSTVMTVHNSVRSQGQAMSQQITQNLNMDSDQAYHPIHPQNHGWRTMTQQQKIANQQIYNHNDGEESTNNYPRYRHFSFQRLQKPPASSTMAGYNED